MKVLALYDHPPIHRDGMWVTTGDAAGIRYLIPGHEMDTNTPVAEALAAVTRPSVPGKPVRIGWTRSRMRPESRRPGCWKPSLMAGQRSAYRHSNE